MAMASAVLVALDVVNTWLDDLPSAAMVVDVINAFCFALPAAETALPAMAMASVVLVAVLEAGLPPDLAKRVFDDCVAEEATEGDDNTKIEEKDDMIVGIN